MNIRLYLIPLAILVMFGCETPLDGNGLLNKAIEYHDPNDKWSIFQDSLVVVMETPDQSPRVSQMYIDLPNEHFYLKASRDTITTEFDLKAEKCSISLNGSSSFSEKEAETHRLSCERANMYKNYYTYLYGLPMKLKDPGTHIDPVVETKNFKGKDYLVLKATYDAEVGTDIWFFYFDPASYAMEIYQFFKTDEDGKLKEDSGEYILLSEESTINGIKMPKVRAWYYNTDDKFLGTDILN